MSETASPKAGSPKAGSPRAASLWAFALDIYGRPGAEARFLALQDGRGQNVCFLIWSLWMAAEGRPADAATLEAGAALATSWEAAAVAPLRRLRRDLKTSSAGPARRRERLRGAVRQLELQAEQMLLEMLQDASPPSDGEALPAAEALARAAALFGGDAPGAELSGAGRAGRVTVSGCAPFLLSRRAGLDRWQGARSVDEEALDPSEEARIRAQIAALREEHQDLDDAVSALEALPMPDQLQIARLKKKKLTLRDQIAKLEDRLTPDIIA